MASRLSDWENSPIHSLTAFQILEENCVTETMIKFQAFFKEESQFLMNSAISSIMPASTLLMAGSFADGLSPLLSLSGEKGDADILDVRHFFRAIPTLAHLVDDPSLCQFLIEENHDNPAYVKLRLLSMGNNPWNLPFFYNKTLVQTQDGMHYLSSSEIKIITKMTFMGSAILNIFNIVDNITSCSITGPATSVNLQNFDFGIRNGYSMEKLDIVFSIPCPLWPDTATEWVRRQRFNNWPSTEIIRRISSQGCYLVPKSRAESTTKNLKWAISFSHVEPLLIHSMNDVMIKTYYILKLVQRFVFKAELGDVVSSYIIKTGLFWEVEEADIGQWAPENLLLCVRRILRRVKNWFDENFAPHYFIRDQNLFHHTLIPAIRRRASHCIDNAICTLDNLFQNIMPFVLSLRSRRMEEIIEKYFNSNPLSKDTEFNGVLVQVLNRFILAFSSFIVPHLIGSFVGKHSSCNWTFLDSLRGVICRIFRDQASTKSRVLILSTLLQKILLLELVKARTGLHRNRDTYYKRKLSSKMLCLCRLTFPVLSLSNLLAYVFRCIVLQDYLKMEKVVHSITHCLCKLETLRFDYTNQHHLLREITGPFLKHLYSSFDEDTYQMPIVVLSEIPLTHIELSFLPPILNLEMECRFEVEKEINPILRLPNENILSVDAEVLFYFVSFTFFHCRDKNIEKYSYLQKLRRLCRSASTMHLHIALNLLGYCQLLIDHHREALKTYHRSLCVQMRNRDLKTVSKATLYHVAILLHKCLSDEWSKTC